MTAGALTDIPMPRLSDSMEEGTILDWLKRIGEEVAVGEELVEIESDKANMAYQSDVAGTLVEILAAAGDTVAVGAPIARIGEAEAVAKTAPAPSGTAEPISPPAAAPAPPTAPQPGRFRPRASPIARRLASERGVDLDRLVGSGPAGRIVRADVEEATTNPVAADARPATAATAKGEVEVVELSRLQQMVARRMAESKATAPHFHLRADVDMTAASAAREGLRALLGEEERAPTFNDMVIKACALALREHPRANGSYVDGRLELFSRVNVGFAVAAEDALVVPTVFDADRKGLAEIAAETRALAVRVRDGAVTPPELAGGTFTVSNLGMFGVAGFEAVINSPQAAILAVGALAERAAVVDGEVVPRLAMTLTLACDHRILYGADGARFLARVKGLMEQPLALSL